MICLEKHNCSTCELIEYDIWSIDAVMDDNSCYVWNNKVRECTVYISPYWDDSKILDTLINSGLIISSTKNRLVVEEYSTFCFEIQDSRNCCPVFALIPAYSDLEV